MFRKARLTKLAQTPEAFEAQAEQFLSSQGFEVNADTKKLFAAFVQHLPQNEDSFDADLLGKMMRKAKANELAFYLMHPDKAPKKEQANDAEGISKATEEVVQKVSG
jgi:hypothetical protein